MLVELGRVEQRHRAVLEVLDGAAVMDVARRSGYRARACTLGCGLTPTGAWPGWPIGRRGRMGVHIRWHLSWRRR